MGIRVLFLYPNTYGMNMLPPAIAFFSAILKKAGHEVELFDATYYQMDYGIDSDGSKMETLNVIPFDMGKYGIQKRDSDWKDDLRRQVDRFRPDLIALSSTEDMWHLGVRLLESIENQIRHNSIPVIVGGVFPTFAPDIVIRHYLVDLVCVGEGENALLDLCKRIEEGSNFNKISNTWAKDRNNHIEKNKITKPVDINENPIIDISLFEEARLYRPMAGRVYRMFPVETHRGCPYTCTFCNSPDQMNLYDKEVGGGFFRKKRMDVVYRELKHLKDNLGCEYNYFWADTFLALNTREFDEFCEMYSDIKLPFWMQTRPETVTDYKIRRLSEVGLHRISFGLEHGNEEFRRKVLDRKWSNGDITDALKIPHKYGIQYSVNNITGFPGETRELAMDTVEINRLIDADNYNIYSFVPFHGTPLRRECERLGLIQPETITKCLTDEPQLELKDYPVREIEGLKKCFILYVKFPKSRWPEIRQAESNTVEGNRLFSELKEEYMSKYFQFPDDNPHSEMPKLADLEHGIVA